MSPFGRRLSVVGRRIKYSTCAKCSNTPSNDSTIRKLVLVSQSTDVFTNLALEDWFYRNRNFSDHHILLLWRNDPCVVIGRHQNPWKECNVETAENRCVTLVRRNSGGGTVYHDSGNLNLSFFTPRERYNRKYNLHVITRALFREWGLLSVVNKRDDIVVDGDYKVSGTAAKLGRLNAYHHCTLLVNVDKDNLSLTLEKRKDDISTNATTSTRSLIKNLIDVESSIEMDKLISVIGKEYLRTNALVLEDEGEESLQKQMGFQFVDPNEDSFPGLDKLTSDFRSWDWNFGKTPEFTVTRILEVSAHDGKILDLNLRLTVQNGIVKEVKLNLLNEKSSSIDFERSTKNVIANFYGTRYNCEITEKIITAINSNIVTLKTTQIEDKRDIIVTR